MTVHTQSRDLPAPIQADSAALSRTVVTQIRNATLKITYAGVRFLVDPILAPRHSFPGFAGTVNSEQPNPMVHLPLPISEIVDVDAVIVTHLHEDHWDKQAQDALNKDLPVFAQNDADADVIRSQGFNDVRVLSETSSFRGVELTKTGGRHGSQAHFDVIADVLGDVCGVVFSHPDEQTLYLAGDTVWNEHVETVLLEHAPDIAILNAGNAMIQGVGGGIIMDAEDVLSVHEAKPDMLLIATHMEAINHCVLTRAELRAFATQKGFEGKLLTPGDGESVRL